MAIGDVNDIFPISKALLFKRRTLNNFSPYFVFFCVQNLPSIYKHTVEHNDMILGVMLKGIMLEFSSIIYLTLLCGSCFQIADLLESF